MRGITAFALAGLLAVSAHAQLRQPISVDGGTIRGMPSARHGVSVFEGIPFAAPPIGDLRWKPPQPIKPWQGTRAADHFSPMCMQKPPATNTVYFSGYETASEDCLYLNVWTPANSPKQKLAVMVWIYGGAFREGSATPRFFDGADLAAKGVIVVTFNYRVGVFGFLAHSELTAESPHHASGNYGLLDQVAALQWVQRNIAAFGGDSSRVTVFGQSAGGASASALVASPLAKGLIARAISESGQLICSPDMQLPLAASEKNGSDFAKSLGADSIADLRKRSAADILAANGTFRLTVDGYFLPASGAQLYAEGRENKVPILVGSNGNESHARATLESYRERVKAQWGEHADEFLRLYPAINDAEASAAQVESTVDEYAFCQWLYAMTHTANGARAYLYRFTHKPPVPDSMYAMKSLGAYHGAEIDYVFGHLRMHPWPWTSADTKLATTISAYWVNFAKTGDPNAKGLPLWPAFRNEHQQFMHFGDATHAEDETLRTQFAFFEKYKELLYPAH